MGLMMNDLQFFTMREFLPTYTYQQLNSEEICEAYSTYLKNFLRYVATNFSQKYDSYIKMRDIHVPLMTAIDSGHIHFFIYAKIIVKNGPEDFCTRNPQHWAKETTQTFMTFMNPVLLEEFIGSLSTVVYYYYTTSPSSLYDRCLYLSDLYLKTKEAYRL